MLSNLINLSDVSHTCTVVYRCTIVLGFSRSAVFGMGEFSFAPNYLLKINILEFSEWYIAST